MDHFESLARYIEKGAISEELGKVIDNFFLSYQEAVEENGYDIRNLQPVLKQFLDLVVEQLKHPHKFEPYHKRVMEPVDYYHHGLDILRPLVVFSKSKVQGLERAQEIEAYLARGENVILLANHQTEPDPQAISLLLENTNPRLAEEMIFVAGHRVISDPLAVPFSMGRNLICIFSKRHLDTLPEKKQEMLRHNQRAMKRLTELMSEGGKCIYVAPSGGRDRKNSCGEIEIAPFDPQSIEMFWLISRQSKRKTRFFTLALATHSLLPPPNSIEKELGERRHAHSTPISMAIGKEIDMEHFPGSETADKKQKRQIRRDCIWSQVFDDYQKLIKE